MIQLIVNPVAGNGKAMRTGVMAHDYLQSREISHEIVHTEYGK